RSSAGVVRRAVEAASPGRFGQPPREGEWSALETLTHLRDVVVHVYGLRIRRLLYEDAPVFADFDEEGYRHACLARGEVVGDLLGQGGGVEASEIKVLSAVAMRAALDELAPEFERQTGQKVAITYATAGVLRDRIQGGEMVDLTILPRPAMDPLVMQGKIAPGTVTIFARSANSVAVRGGAPEPDIS